MSHFEHKWTTPTAEDFGTQFQDYELFEPVYSDPYDTPPSCTNELLQYVDTLGTGIDGEQARINNGWGKPYCSIHMRKWKWDTPC